MENTNITNTSSVIDILNQPIYVDDIIWDILSIVCLFGLFGKNDIVIGFNYIILQNYCESLIFSIFIFNALQIEYIQIVLYYISLFGLIGMTNH